MSAVDTQELMESDWVTLPAWLAAHPGLPPGAKLCYLHLQKLVDQAGECCATRDALSEALAVCTRQIGEYIVYLRDAGLIETWRVYPPLGVGIRLLPCPPCSTTGASEQGQNKVAAA